MFSYISLHKLIALKENIVTVRDITKDKILLEALNKRLYSSENVLQIKLSEYQFHAPLSRMVVYAPQEVEKV